MTWDFNGLLMEMELKKKHKKIHEVQWGAQIRLRSLGLRVFWVHSLDAARQEGGKALLEALQKNERLKEAGRIWEGLKWCDADVICWYLLHLYAFIPEIFVSHVKMGCVPQDQEEGFDLVEPCSLPLRSGSQSFLQFHLPRDGDGNWPDLDDAVTKKGAFCGKRSGHSLDWWTESAETKRNWPAEHPAAWDDVDRHPNAQDIDLQWSSTIHN